MSIVSSSVADIGATRADGRRWVRFEFTDHTGKTHAYGYNKYPSSDDPEVIRAALIAPLEASLKETERQGAWAFGIGGGDIDIANYDWNTTAEIQTWWWRRFMNLFRDESEDPSAGDKIEIAINAAPYYNKPTNPTIAGYLNAGWTNNQVGGALNKIAAVAVNAAQLDHGQAEIPL